MTATYHELRIECDELTLNLLSDERCEAFACISWPEDVRTSDSEPDYALLVGNMYLAILDTLAVENYEPVNHGECRAAVSTAITPGPGFEPSDVTFRVRRVETCVCGQWPVSEYGSRCPSCPRADNEDSIYLTVEQIETLYRETRSGLLVGAELRGDDLARSNVHVVAVRGGNGRSLDNDHLLIEPDGATPGWER